MKRNAKIKLIAVKNMKPVALGNFHYYHMSEQKVAHCERIGRTNGKKIAEKAVEVGKRLFIVVHISAVNARVGNALEVRLGVLDDWMRS